MVWQFTPPSTHGHYTRNCARGLSTLGVRRAAPEGPSYQPELNARTPQARDPAGNLSVAKLLLFLLSECRFRRAFAVMFRLAGVSGLVAERPLLVVTPFLVESRRLIAARLALVRLASARFVTPRLVSPRLAVWPRRPLLAGSIVRGGGSPRRMRPLFGRRRHALRSFGERLDT